jgi:predicted Zn-dependent protease with MMP-like domain
MARDEAYEEIEAVYDALDRGDPAGALELVRRSSDGDPVIRYLEGVALLELGRAAEAAGPLGTAVELDPDDAEFRVGLARSLYHTCRFEEARAQVVAALELDEKLPEAHEIFGLVLEMEGRLDEADRHLARAAELDPGGFPAPRRIDRAEFDRLVRQAAERLPEDFRRHLQAVLVTVEPVPSRDLLTADRPPLDPALLGLFVGVALPEQSPSSRGGELPPRIYLFQRSLERESVDMDDLEEQIAITLYHELGHYLGLTEDELADIDLG